MDVYERKDKAASNSYTLHFIPPSGFDVAAWELETPEERERFMSRLFIGNITFKRSASGTMTKCYLHIWGVELVEGRATGCGYDVASAAFADAVEKWLGKGEQGKSTEHLKAALRVASVKASENLGWKSALREVGVFAAHV